MGAPYIYDISHLRVNAKELEYEDETGAWSHPERALTAAVPNSGFQFQCVN